jgi:hypothetical protein
MALPPLELPPIEKGSPCCRAALLRCGKEGSNWSREMQWVIAGDAMGYCVRLIWGKGSSDALEVRRVGHTNCVVVRTLILRMS